MRLHTPALIGFTRGLGLSVVFFLAILSIDLLVGTKLQWVLPRESALSWLVLTAVAATVYSLIARHLPPQVPVFRLTGASIVVGTGSLLIYAATLSAGLYIAGDGYLKVSSPPYLFQPRYLTMAVCAALIEEFLFRGLLLRSCMVVMPTLVAVVLQAALFSLAHLANEGTGVPHLVSHFLSGVIFAGLALLTRSTVSATLLHAGMNVFSATLFNSTRFGGWGVAAGFRIDRAGFLTPETLSDVRLVSVILLLCLVAVVAYLHKRRSAAALKKIVPTAAKERA